VIRFIRLFGRLAGAGAGPASPASLFQPPAIASILQPAANVQAFKKWHQPIVTHAGFNLSNSKYHAFLDHAVL